MVAWQVTPEDDITAGDRKMTRPKASSLSLFVRFYGWAASLLFAFGIVAAAAAISFAQRDTRMDRDGVEIEANVVTTWSHRNPNRSFHVEVAFFVDDIEYVHAASVTEDFMTYAAERGSVPIRYWANDPSVVELQRGQVSNWVWWSVALALVGLFGGAYWCWRVWNRVAAMRWLETFGERLHLPVLARAKTGTTVNQVEQYHLIWEEPDGTRKQSFMNDPKRFELYPEGTEIEILRDPSGKRPSIWVGDLDVWP